MPEITVFDGSQVAVKVQGYPVEESVSRDLDNRFTYHAPKGDQAVRYGLLRERTGQLAYLIVQLTPPTRERSLALTHLEEASMWANAAIARNE